jgi:hypothetical protein
MPPTLHTDREYVAHFPESVLADKHQFSGDGENNHAVSTYSI